MFGRDFVQFGQRFCLRALLIAFNCLRNVALQLTQFLDVELVQIEFCHRVALLLFHYGRCSAVYQRKTHTSKEYPTSRKSRIFGGEYDHFDRFHGFARGIFIGNSSRSHQNNRSHCTGYPSIMQNGLLFRTTSPLSPKNRTFQGDSVRLPHRCGASRKPGASSSLSNDHKALSSTPDQACERRPLPPTHFLIISWSCFLLMHSIFFLRLPPRFWENYRSERQALSAPLSLPRKDSIMRGGEQHLLRTRAFMAFHLLHWPGKSGRDGGPEHPAIYHMLDVAAVAERLLQASSFPDRWKAAFALLVALHDLGKIGAGFRAMIREGTPQAACHWELTEAWLQDDSWLQDHLHADPWAMRALIPAIAGHHGRPSKQDERFFPRMRSGAGAEATADIPATVEALARLWPDASLAGLDEVQATRLSWWLAGLTTAADWIGSNASWFPARLPDLSPSAYLALARDAAARHVPEAGVAGTTARAGALFDFALRPMQQAAGSAPLSDGQMLAFIEDETGTGKTEAALTLAQRMLLARKGRGLFFALPTMATADAMFVRASDVVGRMLDRPTLTLAHGRAGLSVRFRDLQHGPGRSDDVTCTEWLADDRRRTLLADVGIGTVDQALLAVMPRAHARRPCEAGRRGDGRPARAALGTRKRREARGAHGGGRDGWEGLAGAAGRGGGLSAGGFRGGRLFGDPAAGPCRPAPGPAAIRRHRDDRAPDRRRPSCLPRPDRQGLRSRQGLRLRADADPAGLM